jgi:hypothetical protein
VARKQLTDEQRKQRAQARIRKSAAEAEERAARRAERDAKWAADGMMLTWEEYSSGVLCRGCGQSWERRDGWRDVGSRDRTEEELAVIAAEEARYKEQHGDCHEVRYGVHGSPVLHCGWCCPPTPLGPIARAKLRAILDNRRPNPNLVGWLLTLSCHHAIEAIADEHHEYRPASGSWSEVRVCTTCAETRAVIAVERLGPLQPPTSPTGQPGRGASITMLTKRINQKRAELAELERQLALTRATPDPAD